MSDIMNPLISMTPVIDLKFINDAYFSHLEEMGKQYLLWNTSTSFCEEDEDLNAELQRKGVPNNINCLLKIF